MKYYKDTNNKVYEFKDDVTQEQLDFYINKFSLTTITKDEREELLAPTDEELAEQEQQEAINIAQTYLDDTDFYMTVDKYATLTDERKEELTTLREEAREVIRSYESN